MSSGFEQGAATQMCLSELAENALARAPEFPAIEFDQTWIRWGELCALASKIRLLLDTSGIGEGSTACLVARNQPAVISAFLALLATRLHIRMIYPFQSETGIAEEIASVKPSLVVAMDEDFSTSVRDVIRGLGVYGVSLHGLDANPIDATKRALKSVETDTPLSIEILTSGTTGKPKPFRVSYEMLARDIVGSAAAIKNADTLEPVLLYFPIGNISGLYTTLPAILGGRRIVLLDRFNLAGWHRYILEYRPTVGGLPPAAIQMVLDADIPKEDLASIKVFGAGAAPLDPAVQLAFESRYGIPILLSYGATEFGGPVTRMTPELHAEFGEQKRGTVGRAMPGVKLRVVNPESFEELAPGEEGILEVVSPRIGAEWIRTSDIAVIDKDGFLFHRGRADGAIIRGGFKILPETIEKALLAHQAVSAVSVVGIPDSRLGQVPVAAVVLKPGATLNEQELDLFVRDRVLKTHVPAQWRIIDELPRTKLSYKVDQGAVRSLFVTDSAPFGAKAV